MDSAKSQLIDRLKSANSVLITVSRSPSVDQLAACIGLTIYLNKIGKHGSAVFSGEVPSTIEFLKPEETFEQNADSLRDFIIALDKNKADKLRYKVEDKMVKIFITPYKTSLSDKDLEFSQGDFNVELVIALGVTKQEDLDEAIMAHGRILHDATVACINTNQTSNLGTINWQEQTASSLCELVSDLVVQLDEDKLDEQISTALLTGIIAETHRFSNEKTTPQTMSISAKLMSKGANQQLVATNLADISKDEISKTKPAPAPVKKPAKSNDGTLNIKHDEEEPDITTLPIPKDLPDSDAPPVPTNPNPPNEPDSPRLVTQPPALGGTLTANSAPEQYDPTTDPLSNLPPQNAEPTLTVSDRPIIEPQPEPPLSQQPPPYTPPVFTQPLAPLPPLPPLPPIPTATSQPPNLAPLPTVPSFPPPQPQPTYTPPPPTWAAPVPVAENPDIDDVAKDKTIDKLEEAVESPHVKDVASARGNVEKVLSESDDSEPKADEALNAKPLGEPLHEEQKKAESEALTEIEQIHKSTGLDPSLFSEPPPKDEAPPVPPPIQYPLKPSKDK